MTAKGIIYSRTNKGHKISYGLTLKAIYDFEVRHGERSYVLLRDLVAARNLVFSTLDDDYVTFFLVAFARSICGRNTSALFLRPHTCIAPKFAHQRLKCALFRAVRQLGLANVLTIVSFDAEPRIASLAADWVDDPECFDLDIKLPLGQLPITQLSNEIIDTATGRSIVIMPGELTTRKGLSFLIKVLEIAPALTNKFFFVAAGRIDPGSSGLAKRFSELGGIALDRFITDSELFSLYRVADYLWAAYAPEYDQSSGVFGRALQTAGPLLVREGALIENLANTEGMIVVGLPFDDPWLASARLATVNPHPRPADPVVINTQGNSARRKRFISCIDRGLTVDAQKGVKNG
jgi:glycosyltransferase involved in cell wall biosynthesis